MATPLLNAPLEMSSAYKLLEASDWRHRQAVSGEPLAREMRQMLTFIMESPEPLWFCWGAEKRFFFNDAYLPLLGDKVHGAMGERLDIVWADVWADVGDAIAAVYGGDSRHFVDLQLFMNRDGFMKETFWTFSYSPLRTDDGAVAGLFCVVSEQTERVVDQRRHKNEVASLSDEVTQAQQERAIALDQLRQAQKLEAIGQLTGGVAHDFNNLLQVISGSVDMLREGGISDASRERYIRLIGTAAERAEKLTSQLLAFSRRQSLSPETFDIVSNVSNLAGMVGTLVGARVTVRLDLCNAPVKVHLDRSQLDTALINLAANARDAIKDHGEITLRVRRAAGRDKLRSRKGLIGDYVAVSVSDTGSGIDPASIERIFEPFFTTKPVGEGTGLGLSQVIGFAKQSNGDVDVETVDGQGTTITLFLPCTNGNVAEPQVDSARELSTTVGSHLLVVEDNTEVADFICSSLTEIGYKVAWARDGQEALRFLNETSEPFAAVFSDVVMPGISGLEMAKVMREANPLLPIVLASGYSEALLNDPGHGFAVLRKPYALRDVLAELDKAISTPLAS